MSPRTSAATVRRLVVLGATGDLAGRYLFPALAELREHDRLPEGFAVVGAGRQALEEAAFRDHVAARLAEHAPEVDEEVRAALVGSLGYRQVDLADEHDVATMLGDYDVPTAVYLALPPSVFPTAVRTLAAVGLPEGSRIVLEKPFGEDLANAVELNELLAELVGEDAVFRVDHVLGMATVHNLLGVRLANRVLEPLWNSTHIEQVDVLWDETLALEGRAGYYDRAGALRDVLQNHMLQVLCLVAMEPPASLDAEELRDRKADVLRSVRIPGPDDVVAASRRARYAAGTLAPPPEGAGTPVPAYADEEGVDADRGTETFVELALELDAPRWSGTRFVLRAGKALDRRRKGVVIRFRPVPHLPFGPDVGAPPPNRLRIGLDGPERFTLDLTGSAPGPPAHLAPLPLDAHLPANELPAYSHVLLHVLEGDPTLSIRGDEAELAWRIVTPVLEAWADDRVPLQEYPAGSDGPPDRLSD